MELGELPPNTAQMRGFRLVLATQRRAAILAVIGRYVGMEVFSVKIDFFGESEG